MSQRKISDEQLIAEYNNGLTYKQIAENMACQNATSSAWAQSWRNAV